MGVINIELWRLKMKLFSKIMKNEEGATAIEYGLIAALIAVAAVAAMGAVGNTLTNTFDSVDESMQNADA